MAGGLPALPVAFALRQGGAVCAGPLEQDGLVAELGAGGRVDLECAEQGGCVQGRGWPAATTSPRRLLPCCTAKIGAQVSRWDEARARSLSM
jgi:hypothetical protein